MAIVDRLSCGVVFLSLTGHVAFANRVAVAILHARDGLMLDGDRLRAASSEVSARLHEAVIAARGRNSTDKVLTLVRPSGRPPLIVLIAPTAGDPGNQLAPVVLFLMDCDVTPLAGPHTLNAMYELTPGEARLLTALCEGLSPNEAAARIGVSYDTARKRLSSIFHKTGTGRQPDLVRRVLLSTPPLIEEGG